MGWGHAKAAKEPIPDPKAKAAKDPISDSATISNAAKEAIPDPTPPRWPRAARSPVASACEPHRDFIEEALGRGRLKCHGPSVGHAEPAPGCDGPENIRLPTCPKTPVEDQTRSFVSDKDAR